MPDLYFQDGDMVIGSGSDALAVGSACCCGIDCSDCCTDDRLPADTEVTVDLGTPGLSNGGACAETGTYDCTDITGEFTLDGIFGDCGIDGFFFANDWCEFNGNIEMRLRIVTSGSDCFWRLTILSFGLPGMDLVVIYESTPKTFVENDCTLASAVSLALVSTDFDSFCTGTMADPITIEAVP